MNSAFSPRASKPDNSRADLDTKYSAKKDLDE
jgi:hypothetical protein